MRSRLLSQVGDERLWAGGAERTANGCTPAVHRCAWRQRGATRDGRGVTRRAILLLLGTLSTFGALVATAPKSFAGFDYAGQWGGNWQGIDGYIRGSGTTNVPSPDHRANWIGISTEDGSGGWVQMGVYQGYIANGLVSPNHVDIYTEHHQCIDKYDFDWGVPPSPNYPYYLTVVPNSYHYDSDCGNYVWTFAFRKGSYTSSPFDTAILQSPTGEAIANTELYWPTNGTITPSGNDYFGTDSNHNASPSYGLHVYNGGWQLWSSASDPGVYGASGSHAGYSNLAPYYAFRTYHK